MRIRRDDQIVILSGEEKGKRGKILRVIPDRKKVVVEGLNYVWKHLRKSADHPHGARIQREAPLAWCKVQLICQSCSKPARIRIQATADGKRVRICKKCGQAVNPAV
jgi:large subunit ribosomal protein L24